MSLCAMARPTRQIAHRRREVLAHLPLASGPQPTRASTHTLLRGKENPMREASGDRYRPLRQARPRGGVGVKDNLLPRFPSGPAALATCAPQKRRLLGRSLWAGVGGGGRPPLNCRLGLMQPCAMSSGVEFVPESQYQPRNMGIHLAAFACANARLACWNINVPPSPVHPRSGCAGHGLQTSGARRKRYRARNPLRSRHVSCAPVDAQEAASLACADVFLQYALRINKSGQQAMP